MQRCRVKAVTQLSWWADFPQATRFSRECLEMKGILVGAHSPPVPFGVCMAKSTESVTFHTAPFYSFLQIFAVNGFQTQICPAFSSHWLQLHLPNCNWDWTTIFCTGVLFVLWVMSWSRLFSTDAKYLTNCLWFVSLFPLELAVLRSKPAPPECSWLPELGANTAECLFPFCGLGLSSVHAGQNDCRAMKWNNRNYKLFYSWMVSEDHQLLKVLILQQLLAHCGIWD